MMWRITPESSIASKKHIHPEIVMNLKGRTLETDYCIKHYGHIDKERNHRRAEFCKTIDNPSLPNWTGYTYEHLTDEDSVQLTQWREDQPISERDFGKPSVLLVCLHANGDNLMLTPTVRQMKADNPDLEISIMGMEKTEQKDFKTHQIWENNPLIHQYYPSTIDHHPAWWDQGLFNQRSLPVIKHDLNRIQQTTRFDDVIILTLQDDDRTGHRIDRYARACGVELEDRQMEMYTTIGEGLSIEQWIDKSLPDWDSSKTYISVHRWCGHPPKSWDYQEYKTLVEWLSGLKNILNDTVKIILWDMGDPEPVIRGENIINMCDYEDDLTIEKSAAIMSRCSLHIGADSLPMHMASTKFVNIKTLAIFDKTLPSIAYPVHDKGVIACSVSTLSQSPQSFYDEHSHRIVECGVNDVKAEHLYPVIHKMLGLDKYEIPKTTIHLEDVPFSLMPIEVPKGEAWHYDNGITFNERKVHDTLKHYAKDDSVFMDIGANIGLHSLLLRDSVKEGIAIEPLPETYEMLTNNLKGSSFTTHQNAIGATDEHVWVNYTPRQSKTSYTGKQTYLSERIRQVTLDSLRYVPDIVKIDVEGSELDVLMGGIKTWNKARAIVIELHGRNDNQVIQVLKEQGFGIRFLTPRHIVATHKDEKVIPFPQNCLFDPCELLTRQTYSRLRLFSEYMQHPEVIQPIDETMWFEWCGLSSVDMNKQKIAIYEHGNLFTQGYSKYFDVVRVDDIPSTPRVGNLIALNMLGYEDGDNRFFQLFERCRPKQVYLNFPFANTSEGVRYRGQYIQPFTYEKLQSFLKVMNERGFYEVGDTDFYNVDITDRQNYPVANQPITRGRILFKDEVPF